MGGNLGGILTKSSDGSVKLPDGFRIYTCTDCQEMNVKKDNRKVKVGYCDKCDHPLWNGVEDVPHD